MTAAEQPEIAVRSDTGATPARSCSAPALTGVRTILIANAIQGTGMERVAGIAVHRNKPIRNADLCVDCHTDAPLLASRFYPRERRVFLTLESPLHLASWTRRYGAAVLPENYAMVLTNDPGWLRAPNARRACVAEAWMAQHGTEGKQFRVDAMFSGKRRTFMYGWRQEMAEREKEITVPHRVFHSFGKNSGDPWMEHHRFPTKNIMADAMFQLVTENVVAPGYFTEKVVDCFVTHTVPLYAGDPDLGAEWNLDGVIVLERNRWLEQVNALTPDDWARRLPAMRDNYRRARNYLTHSRSLVYWLIRHGVIDVPLTDVVEHSEPDANLPCNQAKATATWPQDIVDTHADTQVIAPPVAEVKPPPLPITAAAPVTPATLPPDLSVMSRPACPELPESLMPVPVPSQDVYCFLHYFQDTNFRVELDLLEIWHASWKAAGWTPRIVGWADLAWEDWQVRCFRTFNQLPTQNARAYTVGNLMRWAFMAQLPQGGWLCDHDVINYGFGPRAVTEQGVTWARGEYVPGLTSGPPDAYRIQAQKWVKTAGLLSKVHVGEVGLFQRDRPFMQLPLVALYGDEGWKTASVVHYANRLTQPYREREKCTRAALVLKERRPCK